MTLSNRAISSAAGHHGEADAVATLDRPLLLDLSANATDIETALAEGRVDVEGDVTALLAVFGHLDTFQSMFPIVEP